MTILEMIAEWRKGCSIAGPACGQDDSPANCSECTEGLIDAIERKVRSERQPRIDILPAHRRPAHGGYPDTSKIPHVRQWLPRVGPIPGVLDCGAEMSIELRDAAYDNSSDLAPKIFKGDIDVLVSEGKGGRIVDRFRRDCLDPSKIPSLERVFEITTGDPMFKPDMPVIVNGYRFVREQSDDGK